MELWTAAALVEEVDAWCQKHQLHPANGQASEALSERTIRYYRTLGLLDPLTEDGRFTELHRLQLLAIRILQAEGLPLRRIRQLLQGRPEEQLEELVRRAAEQSRKPAPAPAESVSGGWRQSGTISREEDWRMTPLTDDYLLISRSGRRPTAAVLHEVIRLLSTPNSSKQP